MILPAVRAAPGLTEQDFRDHADPSTQRVDIGEQHGSEDRTSDIHRRSDHVDVVPSLGRGGATDRGTRAKSYAPDAPAR